VADLGLEGAMDCANSFVSGGSACLETGRIVHGNGPKNTERGEIFVRFAGLSLSITLEARRTGATVKYY
jgi:hypothetical protein